MSERISSIASFLDYFVFIYLNKSVIIISNGLVSVIKLFDRRSSLINTYFLNDIQSNTVELCANTDVTYP